MTEGEVNARVKQWILDNGYEYSGVLSGHGKVSVVNGVSIDHQGIRCYPIETVWIEAQGSCGGIEKLLNGFIAILFASGHSEFPRSILAVPHEEYIRLVEHREFLVTLAKTQNAPVGLFDVEASLLDWLNVTP